MGVVGFGLVGVTAGVDGSVGPVGTGPVGGVAVGVVGPEGIVGSVEEGVDVVDGMTEAVVCAVGRTSSILTRGPHPPSSTALSSHTSIIAQGGTRFRFVFMLFVHSPRIVHTCERIIKSI